jgi:hypothetical protein
MNLEALEKAWEVKEKQLLKDYRKDQANWRKINKVKRMRLAGLRSKEIAKKLGISLDTVTRYTYHANSERKNF